MKNLSNKFNNSDLKETGFNMGVAWFVGNVANTISNTVFHFDLDQYHSVKHLTASVGIGTYTYRKAGGGIKGILAALGAISLLGPGWEYFENTYVFHNNNLDIDTISDIAVGYAGVTLSFFGEGIKEYINSKKNHLAGKEKWLV